MKSRKITKVIPIQPVQDVNVRTKFHANPPNSCWAISLKTTKFNLMVALEEKSGAQNSQ